MLFQVSEILKERTRVDLLYQGVYQIDTLKI